MARFVLYYISLFMLNMVSALNASVCITAVMYESAPECIRLSINCPKDQARAFQSASRQPEPVPSGLPELLATAMMPHDPGPWVFYGKPVEVQGPDSYAFSCIRLPPTTTIMLHLGAGYVLTVPTARIPTEILGELARMKFMAKREEGSDYVIWLQPPNLPPEQRFAEWLGKVMGYDLGLIKVRWLDKDDMRHHMVVQPLRFITSIPRAEPQIGEVDALVRACYQTPGKIEIAQGRRTLWITPSTPLDYTKRRHKLCALYDYPYYRCDGSTYALLLSDCVNGFPLAQKEYLTGWTFSDPDDDDPGILIRPNTDYVIGGILPDTDEAEERFIPQSQNGEPWVLSPNIRISLAEFMYRFFTASYITWNPSA